MLQFSLISILLIILSSWGVLSGKIYRNPFLLVSLGLCFSLYGAWLSHTLSEMSNNALMVEIFPSLSLSATLFNYTIAAIGGSLIASGLVLKAQMLHEEEKSTAMQQLKTWLNELEIANDMDRSLRAIAPSLSNSDFKKQHKTIKERKSRTAIELIKIRHKYKHLLSEGKATWG